jgi:diguanylate cyclase (GGDEF)-like protein
MHRIITCLTVEHDWRLVVLAGLVCFLASLAAISLFRRARASTGKMRALWLVVAGTATGFGIWATHFIAMLAYNPGLPVAYDVARTVLSLLAAAVVTGAGLATAISGVIRRAASIGGGIVGIGVAIMHYTGMSALELPGSILWAPELVAASVVVGILFSMAALAVAARREGKRPTLVAALLLTLAIVSHHFTAMGAVEVVPDPSRVFSAFSLSPTTLAIAISNAAVAVLGLSLASAFADRRLQEKDLQLAVAVNNMAQGLVMFDADERLVVCNQRYLEMYGLSPDEIKPGSTLRDLIRRRAATGSLDCDPEQYRAELLSAMRQGKTVSWTIEYSDGRAIYIVNRPAGNGSWVSTHEDITDRRRNEARIEHLAHHDLLTDLPNRLAFNARLQEVLAHAAKSGGRVAVLCIDLDRFKEVNDVFGHSVGDALLKEVADRLRAAAGSAFLARLGGDEFTLIAAEGEQPATAAALAERLLAAVDECLEIDGHQLRVGLSIGAAVYPADGSDASILLRNADAALYRAKAEGRGTVRFFEASMDERLRERRALQHELRSAIAHNQLLLHYQPQALIGGEIVGFEALVRWRHPTRGLISPGTFIPIAEESGLIIPIGEWILREACREAASWSKPLHIAVNLSPVQFRHGDLPSLVHAILLETGLPASRLELEITETVLMDDPSRALSVLRRLKALGLRIAMDDFGTGYSSLSYLQSFPFDKIKIDRSFIANIHRNQSSAIVRAVIGLGRGLALPVVAEGVETREQAAFLSGEACAGIQGYLVGRPGPITDYADIVGARSVGGKVASAA